MNSECIKNVLSIADKNYIAEVGFCKLEKENLRDELKPYNYAISIVYRLSDAIVDGITTQPSYTYFHHYRTVNAHLDNAALLIAAELERAGYYAFPVPASQTVHDTDARHCGVFSHKMAAIKAGMGYIGKSALFISNSFGCRVRLATVLTNMPLPLLFAPYETEGCGSCTLCVDACPACAIKGVQWHEGIEGIEGIERDELIDVCKCADYMRNNLMHIGRGSVCGICMKVCPAGHRQK